MGETGVLDAPQAGDAPVVRGRRMPNRARWIAWSTLAIVLAAVVFVQLWHLGAGDGAIDEDAYVNSGWDYVHGSFVSHLEHPPFARYLMGSAQVIFGRGVDSARIADAVAAIAAAVILAVFVYRIAGWVAAVAAAALSGLVPHEGVQHWSSVGYRIDRLALLDPIAACFVALALWAGWEARVRASWRWAALAGAGTALAATSKSPGGLVAPVIVVAIVWTPSLRKAWRAAVARVGAYVGAALVATGLVYLPLGVHGTLHQLKYMWDFQRANGAGGHAVLIGNTVYQTPPWWAGLRFMFDGVGPLWMTLIAVLAIVAVCSAATRAPAVYALSATLVTFLGLAFGKQGLMLPHYYLLWLPGIVVAAALGVSQVVVWAQRERWSSAIVTVGLALLLAVLVASSTATIATAGDGDYGKAARVIVASNASRAYIVGDGWLLIQQLHGRADVRDLTARIVGHDIDALVVDPIAARRSTTLTKLIEKWRASRPTDEYRTEQIGRLELLLRAQPR